MTKRTRTPTMGQITVDLESRSVFLGRAVPIEVRDSGMRLIARADNSRTLDLPAGLYEVSAVLEDGCKHSALVQVSGGEKTPVQLAPDRDTRVIAAVAEAEGVSSQHYERPRFTRSMASALGTEAKLVSEGAAEAQLVAVQGASLLRETRTIRVFQCVPPANAVPTALFQVGERRLRISLPIGSGGGSTPDTCAVRIERSPTGVHAQAWISPERTVANALQNMLSSGYVLEAARVADDAVELLRDKYQDPAGAALGALLLYKTGRLQRLESWVENLARDFAWLPDGKVLLARLRYEREAASGVALGLALEASRQVMLFAESYSLMLDLLRRWPHAEASKTRQEALERLANDSPDIDWESTCLSQWLPSGED